MTNTELQAVGTLTQLENEICREYNTDGRPRDDIWGLLVLDLAKKIFQTVDPDDITEDVLDQLTTINYHTARNAAEIVKYLDKYTLNNMYTPLF